MSNVSLILYVHGIRKQILKHYKDNPKMKKQRFCSLENVGIFASNWRKHMRCRRKEKKNEEKTVHSRLRHK